MAFDPPPDLIHTPAKHRAPWGRRRTLRWLGRSIPLVLLLTVLLVIVYNTHKPLPPGISYEGPAHRVQSVEFIYDLSYKREGVSVHEQRIMSRILSAIEQAKSFIVIDMFLFNGYVNSGDSYPKLSQELTDKLIAQKQKYPGLHIVFITDEVNTSYGAHPLPELEQLKRAGIQTVITDTDALRDSTPLYSGIWRTFFRWFGTEGRGWIANPMADTAPDVTLRAYLKLLNVKANHRKVLATENIALVSSGNPHNASADHSNAAFALQGNIISDVLTSEQAAVNLSGGVTLPNYPAQTPEEGDVRVRLLTEGKVFARVLQTLAASGQGDEVWMGMFYLANPEVLQALKDASARGAEIRLILDPNQNAFGNDKIGLPNRPVAEELVEKSEGRIHVRWYNTAQEQYHTKLLMVTGKNKSTIFSGSTNFTTRNLADFNLETDLMIEAPASSPVSRQVGQYFDRLWTNQDAQYTLDYEAYKESTYPLKRAVYHLQEWLGFTTF